MRPMTDETTELNGIYRSRNSSQRVRVYCVEGAVMACGIHGNCFIGTKEKFVDLFTPDVNTGIRITSQI